MKVNTAALPGLASAVVACVCYFAGITDAGRLAIDGVFAALLAVVVPVAANAVKSQAKAEEREQVIAEVKALDPNP